MSSTATRTSAGSRPSAAATSAAIESRPAFVFTSSGLTAAATAALASVLEIGTSRCAITADTSSGAAMMRRISSCEVTGGASSRESATLETSFSMATRASSAMVSGDITASIIRISSAWPSWAWLAASAVTVRVVCTLPSASVVVSVRAVWPLECSIWIDVMPLGMALGRVMGPEKVVGSWVAICWSGMMRMQGVHPAAAAGDWRERMPEKSELRDGMRITRNLGISSLSSPEP
mmetsp:Transcript_66928/g.159669  ORF Transcript_66928/g.159669 Transcript_66928/m.159669 type:complete len:234 (+) Transcript_66928:436-1137(+)